MAILKNRATRALILIMIALVLIAVVISKIYYTGANQSVDPRIVKARQLYSGYNTYAGSGNYFRLFSLLDSIDAIYSLYPHYHDSYETGVIYNNRAAALLTIALYGDSIRVDYNPCHGISSDSVGRLAEVNISKAVTIYNRWSDHYSGMSQEEIMEEIRPLFCQDLDVADQGLAEKMLRNRAGEIFNSVPETARRLSVCYTNLGVLYRHRGEYEKAAEYYRQALQLWDRNLSAENNLNILLGRPLKKRNILQKLFPPDREEGV